MAVCQKKACRTVIKFCAQPTVEQMATLAIAGGKCRASLGVIGIGGILPILQVAGIALRGKSEELANSGAPMTGFARNRGMRPQQWETILVILHRLRRDIPALHGVTLLAVRTHLSAMNVGVAIGAILSDVGENRFGVALDALHFFV